MNGNIACQRVREFEKQRGLPPLPILITSGNNSPEDRIAYAAAAADGIIPKPIDMGALLSDIEKIISVRELGLPAKFSPPEDFGEVPLNDESAEERAKRITQLSKSMGAFPWRPSETAAGPQEQED